MKRLLVLAFLALTASCGRMGHGETLIVSSRPAAEMARLDEQLAIGAENAYQAAAQAMISADQAGLLDHAQRERLRAIDADAYAKLKLVRRAYLLGNARSYNSALTEAWGALQQLFNLTPNVRSGA